MATAADALNIRSCFLLVSGSTLWYNKLIKLRKERVRE